MQDQTTKSAETAKGIDFVKTVAKNVASVKKVILFGSRASQTEGPKSDFDFAFEWVQTGSDCWGGFAILVREQFPFLNTLDLVRLDEISDVFKAKIAAEGVIVYEQT